MCLSHFQVSSAPNLGPPQAGRDALKEHSSSQLVVYQSVSRKKLTKTNEIQESDERIMQRELQPLLQFSESGSVHEETCASLLGSQSQTSDVVVSVVDDPTLPTENEINVLPHLTLTHESDALLPQMAVSELMESNLKVNKTEARYHQELEILGKSQHSADDVPKVVGKCDDAGADTECEATSYNSFYNETARTELYTFYESEQPEAEQAKASSLASLVNGNVNDNGLSSSTRHSVFKGYKLSTKGPFNDKGCASKSSL